jgi:hypothetical protein
MESRKTSENPPLLTTDSRTARDDPSSSRVDERGEDAGGLYAKEGDARHSGPGSFLVALSEDDRKKLLEYSREHTYNETLECERLLGSGKSWEEACRLMKSKEAPIAHHPGTHRGGDVRGGGPGFTEPSSSGKY